MPLRLPAAALAAPLALLALLAAAPPAAGQDRTDTVDLELAGNATVQGTIRGPLERESFLLRLPEGAAVSAVAKRKGKGRFVPRLDFVDAADEVLATGVVKGKGSILRAEPVAASGDHRVRVFGDGETDGDYTLKLSVRLRGKWRGTGTTDALLKAFSNGYEFGAPAGATAAVKVSPAKGSDFVPELEGIEGPQGYSIPLAGTRAANVPLGAAGTYTVGFRDAGGAGGAWVVDVTLKIPRTTPSKIDISASALTGDFSAEEPVFGREVGADGGLVDPPDLGGPLDGATIAIPPGGLDDPVVITMHEADPYDLLNGDHPAGPVIEFGPPGTSFAPGKEAIVTIPYDTTQFTDPENEVRVYVLHNGVVEEVSPLTFPAEGFVSFPTSGFSRFVVGRDGPRPLRGDWALASLELSATDDWGGRVEAEVATVSFDGRSGYSIQHLSQGVEWIRDFDGTGPQLQYPGTFEQEAGFVNVLDDSTISLQPFEESPVVLRRGHSDDVLLVPPDAQGGHAGFALLLRQIDGQATPSNLAGRWHVLYAGAGAVQEGQSQAGPEIDLFQQQGRGTVTFTTDGKCSFSLDEFGAQAPFPQGTGWQARRRRERGTGTFTVFGSEVSVFTGPPYVPGGPEPDPPIRMRVCVGGDVMVGVPGDGEPEIIFMFREATGLKPSLLTGTTTCYGVSVERITPSAGSGVPPSLRMSSLTLAAKHVGTKTLDVAGPFGFAYGHGAEGQAAVDFVADEAGLGTFALGADGAYRTSFEIFGAVSRRGDLLVLCGAPEESVEMYVGVPRTEFGGGQQQVNKGD